MYDVRIDFTAMEASKTAYANMRATLEGSTNALSDVSSSAVPQEELRNKLEDLHDSWGGGLKKLVRYSDDAGAGLAGILEAFQGLDTELAASMEQEEGTA